MCLLYKKAVRRVVKSSQLFNGIEMKCPFSDSALFYFARVGYTDNDYNLKETVFKEISIEINFIYNSRFSSGIKFIGCDGSNTT
jgi:hypothetical protein